jgi:hypothetical protein
MESLASTFIDIFDGLERAYGTYQIDTAKQNGKQVGRAATLNKPVTEKLWEDHLSGKKGIGIIPIKDNSCCKFGAIDIDIYAGLDFKQIYKEVKQHKFPLVVCRSKSGGCHLFLFTKEEVPAALIQGKLKAMAAVLGHGNCEIYPRQTEILVERGDIGQWINVPYFNGVKGLRYAVDEAGAPVSAHDFIKLVEEVRLTLQQLEAIQIVVKADLEDGPPCLQYLITQGFPVGVRNEGLFNLGVYLKKAFQDNWKEKVDEFNHKYLKPPLTSTDVQGVLKSLRKKDYFYKCQSAPLVSYCNKQLCMTRQYGIGASTLPTLGNLTKYNSAPPIWFVTVEDTGRLELTTDDLQNPIRFQKRCMEALNLMPPIPPREKWQPVIQKLLEQVTIIEAPADASPVGQLIEYLEKFCTSRVQAQNKDELLLGKPLTEGGRHFFRMSDFMAYLERQHFREFKVNKVTSIIKEKFKSEHHFLLLKGKGVNFWSIQEFDHQTEGHDVPTFENTEPY